MMFKKRNLRKITSDQKADLLGNPEKQAEKMKHLEEKNAKNPASLTSTEIKTLMEYRQRVRDGKAAGLNPSIKDLFALHPGRNEPTFPESPVSSNIMDVTQKPDLSDEKIPKNTLFAIIRPVPASKCVDLGSGPL